MSSHLTTAYCPLTTEQRASVVAEARSWIGTPYHHGADVKGHGVDCGMLLVRVFTDAGIAAVTDPRPYSPNWHLHRDEERYLAIVEEFGHEVEVPEMGDVILWKYGRTFSHGAIVTQWSNRRRLVVHALRQSMIVEESDLMLAGPLSDPNRSRRYFSAFSSQ